MVEVPDMHNIRLHLSQHLGKALINPFSPVSVLEPRVIHQMAGRFLRRQGLAPDEDGNWSEVDPLSRQ